MTTAELDELSRRYTELIELACVCRKQAFAPFSGFQVGAALETAGGIVTGCNVESASYGLTICAERTAIVKATSEGIRGCSRVVVVAATDNPTPPCGACRQLLWEFGGDCEILLAHSETKRVAAVYRMSELLPYPFDARLLGK